MRVKINANTLLSCMLVAFWCKTPIVSALSSLIGRTAANDLLNAALLVMFVTYAVCFRVQDSIKVFLVYVFIALLILITLYVHPDYLDWYKHSQYGIDKQFLDLGGAIWAFLLISLYRDDERLLRDLKILTAIVFAAYFFKYLGAAFRGYWIVGMSGKHRSYDLEFGFRIQFATAFWGAYGLLKNKRYLYLYALGLIVILLGGSRAAFIWALAVLAAVIPFRYGGMSPRKKKITIVTCVLMIPVTILVITNLELILAFGAVALKKIGITSRTLTSMAKGTLSDDHARDVIYKMARNRIHSGGLFGWGFYGDRVYIGKRFYWGYSHNVFLELLVTLGYLGGSIAIFLLVRGIFRLFKKAKDSTRQVILLTFFCASLRLILSSSFWYEPSFWAMLALMLTWGKKAVRAEKEPVQLEWRTA